jgi:hypothetical protein
MMNHLMVDIDVTNVMSINNGRLPAFDVSFNQLDDSKPIQRVEPVIWQALHDKFSCSENPVGFICCSSQFLQPFSLGSRPRPARDTLSHDHYANLVTSASMACDQAAAAEHLVIWVGCYYQYFCHPLYLRVRESGSTMQLMCHASKPLFHKIN